MKIVFSLLAALIIASAAIGQTLSSNSHRLKGRGEVSIGYGYVTREQLLNGMGWNNKSYTSDGYFNNYVQSDVAERVFNTTANVRYGNKIRPGALFASYRYHLFNWLSIGLAAGYDPEYSNLNISGTKIGNYRRNAFTIAPEARLTYRHSAFVSYYSYFGLGVTFVSEKISGDIRYEKVTGDHFNFQLTPVGIKVGRKLSGFCEIGYGYKGAISLGGSYLF